MTQHMMSASGNRNIEAEVILIDAETRKLQMQLDLAKTELELKKLEPDIMRRLHDENSRMREFEAQMAASKLEQAKVEHGGRLFNTFDRVLIVAIIVVLSYQMFRK